MSFDWTSFRHDAGGDLGLFDLADATHTVGAPSFACFVLRRAGTTTPAQEVSRSRAGSIVPALAKNARTGHPQDRWRKQESTVKGWGHPPTRDHENFFAEFSSCDFVSFVVLILLPSD